VSGPMKKSDYKPYMERAIELAARGWGRTSPNPMVGAIVLKNGKIVGEGYHQGPGMDHAEVAAIKAAGSKAKGADVVVNLEPCHHHGRTPPCTRIIIEKKIKRVVYGMVDPDVRVHGRGIKALKNAGIETVGPVMEAECRSLNRIFVHVSRHHRPYIISKVALSLDGKVALENGKSKWITNKKCRERMHYWRSGVDAVLVGAETVRKDNPRLNVRGLGRVKQPRPIVITSSGKLKSNYRLWRRSPKPIVICPKGTSLANLEKMGVHVVSNSRSGKRIDWNFIFDQLRDFGISSVLVEGGAEIHSQLIKKGLPQYMIVSMSTRLIGEGGVDWLKGLKVHSMKKTPKVKPDQILVLDDNVVIEGEIMY